ncbi:MAG: glycosyltransferase family 2 protein [Flavobacteriales bacterium]
MQSQLTVVIITFNEERNIRRCIESVLPLDPKVILLDSFSTDRTSAIASELGAAFYQHAFDGHIQQKNRVLAMAQTEWVLSLDADEALDGSLVESIREAIHSDTHLGYTMNRLTNYCGHWVKHCGWDPDTKLRLVKKNQAEWRGVNPHDRLELFVGSQGHLSGDILHYSYYTQEDHLRQIEYFGKIAAQELFQRGKRVGVPEIYLKVFAQFIKSYFFKLGLLDGRIGWTISRLSAYATYRKYSILRSLYAS